MGFLIEKNKKQKNKTNKGFKSLVSLTFFFNAEKSVTNKMFTIQSKIYPHPLHPLFKCPTTPMVSMQSIKKCSEVSSGLRRPKMGPGWH